MQPVLIHIDSEKQQTIINRLEALLPFYNNALKEYSKLNIDALSPDELPRLFNDTDILIFDKQLADKPMSLGGLSLNKEKAMELVEKPEGFIHLKTAVAVVYERTKEFNESSDYRIGSLALDKLQLNSKGEFEISFATLTDVKERCSYYASSERSQKLLSLVNAILKETEDPVLQKMILIDGDGLLGLIKKSFPDYNSSHKLEQLKVSGTKLVKFNNENYY